jgi:predicted membrane protein
MGKLRSFGFGGLFTTVVALFIFFYAKDKGWTIVTWISGIYLFITVGIFAIVLAISLLFLLFMLIVGIIQRIKKSSHKKTETRQKKKDDEEKNNVIDAEFIEYDNKKQE